MAYFKEIVTKAIIGKAKKSTTKEHEVEIDSNINTVLGCWVINHTFSGLNNGGKVLVNGSYDINIWYSYDNNTKTNVLVRNFTYQDTMSVNVRDNSDLSNSEIIVRSLNQPSVTDVNVEGNIIKLNVHKELGVEVIGDATVRVSVEDDEDEYEEILDEEIENIDVDSINEDYLN